MRPYLGILLAFVLLTACGKKNQYPNTPQIELRSVTLFPSTSESLDSMAVDIRFTDGDGNLGTTAEERALPPFNKFPVPADTTYDKLKVYLANNDLSYFNLRYYNFFLTLFAENASGRFDTLAGTPAYKKNRTKTDSVRYQDELSRYGSFQPTPDMNKGDPLEGYIRYVFSDFLIALPGQPPANNRGRIFAGKRYYVTLRIMDRDGNLSNKVTSPIYTYNP